MRIGVTLACFVFAASAATESRREAVAQLSIPDNVKELTLEDIQGGGSKPDEENTLPREEVFEYELRQAAAKGDLKVVRILLDIRTDVNAADADGHTALMFAALGEHVDVVKLLLRRHADVNAQNNAGTTALIYAALADNLDIVKFLVKAGADVEVEDRLHRSALMSTTSAKVFKFLLPFSFKKGCLDGVLKQTDGRSAAALFSIVDGVEELTLDDLNKNEPEEKKQDAAALKKGLEAELRKVAKDGDLSLVRGLLGFRIDVNAADADGHTALVYAIAGGHLSVVNHLIRREADVNVRNAVDTTPLMFAATTKHVDIVERLLAAGADVRAVNRFGHSALDAAKTVDMMKALLPALVDNAACY